jgi:dihydrofolate reductase
MLRLIAAVDSELGVANDQGLPWQGRIPTDAQYFRDKTTEGFIVMGFATYQEFERPVHDRDNFVVARPESGKLRPGFVGVSDVTSFLDEHESELAWIIGGAALFAKTLADADELYLTQLDRDFQCTKFFPTFSDSFERVSDDGPHVESGISFRFQVWHRRDRIRRA